MEWSLVSGDGAQTFAGFVLTFIKLGRENLRGGVDLVFQVSEWSGVI